MSGTAPLESRAHDAKESSHHVLKILFQLPAIILLSDNIRGYAKLNNYFAGYGGAQSWFGGIGNYTNPPTAAEWLLGNFLSAGAKLIDVVEDGTEHSTLYFSTAIGGGDRTVDFQAERDDGLFGTYTDSGGVRPASLIGDLVISPWPGPYEVQFDNTFKTFATGIRGATWDGTAFAPEPGVGASTPNFGYVHPFDASLVVLLDGDASAVWHIILRDDFSVTPFTITWHMTDATGYTPYGVYSVPVTTGTPPGGIPATITVTKLFPP